MLKSLNKKSRDPFKIDEAHGYPINRFNEKSRFGLLEFMIIITIVAFAIAFVSPIVVGAGGFGPTVKRTITVNRLYVDSGHDSSSYMVATDSGVFEVDNGLILGIFNADEVYSQLQVGETYNVTTKGNRVVNFFLQKYPYIVKVNRVN